MLVENSWFHDNHGTGLWFDIDSEGVEVRSNRVEGNKRWGIFYEVSRRAKIYWNEAYQNTRMPDDEELIGAGIAVSNSAQVEIYENLLSGNTNGIVIK